MATLHDLSTVTTHSFLVRGDHGDTVGVISRERRPLGSNKAPWKCWFNRVVLGETKTKREAVALLVRADKARPAS